MPVTQILPSYLIASPVPLAHTALARATRSKRYHCFRATGASHAMRLTYASAQTSMQAVTRLVSEAQERSAYSGQPGPTANYATSLTGPVTIEIIGASSAKPRES